MISLLILLLSQVLGRCHQSHAGSCARVYFHHNCHGPSRSVGNGAAVGNIGSFWNDQVSSIVVKNGCRLRAFEHFYFWGKEQIFGGKVSFLGHHIWNGRYGRRTWNDNISSWTCICKSGSYIPWYY